VGCLQLAFGDVDEDVFLEIEQLENGQGISLAVNGAQVVARKWELGSRRQYKVVLTGDSLTSFGSMHSGQLAGDISAGALAATPIPASLVGAGLLNCSQAYTSANTLLDVLVGGCSILGGGITLIKPTQPDRAAVAGDTYAFTRDATTKRVTGCTHNGAAASLADCLAAAVYSSYFRFTTDRVIVVKP
jgi:hypothetical protein